jgi:transposase, IS5 family
MLRCNPVDSGQEDMFRERLDSIINMSHRLVKLSRIIRWDSLESAVSKHYCLDNGRPGGSVRLMMGLLILKDILGQSDESVCERWVENPYWQYFCGEEFFKHKFPVTPESLSYFRKRIGESGMECILAETIRLGLVAGVVTKKDIENITVDTTVQEKAVTFPTDSKLRHCARKELVLLAKQYDVPLRQTYVRKSKNALFMSNRYSAARQMGRAKKEQRKIKTYLGCVIRNIEREILKRPDLAFAFKEALEKAKVALAQEKNSKSKIYSWHAPEVECIAKGKLNKKYEFGCKASFASTNKSNFIVGAKAFHQRPYDGKTLLTALNQVSRLTGITPKEAQVDQGYKGHNVTKTNVIISRQKRNVTNAIKRRQKRRNAIEPIIGHCKNDREIGPRNYLKTVLGDQINTISMAIGFNLRKILNAILLYLFYSTNKNQNYNPV